MIRLAFALVGIAATVALVIWSGKYPSDLSSLRAICEPSETNISCTRQWMGTLGVFLIGCVAAIVAFQQKREMRRQSRIQELTLLNEKKRAVLSLRDEVEYLRDGLSWLHAVAATFTPEDKDEPETLLKAFTKEPTIIDLCLKLHRSSLYIHVESNFDFPDFTGQVSYLQDEIEAVVAYFEGKNEDAVHRIPGIAKEAQAAVERLLEYRNAVSDVIWSIDAEIDNTLRIGRRKPFS